MLMDHHLRTSLTFLLLHLVSALAFAQPCGSCGSELILDTAVRIDLGADPAAVNGNDALAALLVADRSGDDPAAWNAVFDLGDRALVVASTGSITLAAVPTGVPDRFASPGLTLRTSCSMRVDAGGVIELEGENGDTGPLVLEAQRGFAIEGTLANRIQGTWGTTGAISLTSGCGDLMIGPGGAVLLEGVQEGAGDLFLRTTLPEGDLIIDGLVDASFAWGNSPHIFLHADQGSISIDGTHFRELEPFSNRRISSGVTLRSTAHPRPGNIEILALNDIRLQGYSDDAWRDQTAHSFTFNTPMRPNGEAVTVSTTLAGDANPDTVRVALAAPPGSGRLVAVFGNLNDELLVPQLVAGGPHLGEKRAFAVNGVDGLPDAWIAPPGAWDFGLSLDPDAAAPHVATVTLTAPGLDWPQLLAAQTGGWSLGLLIQPPASSKNDTFLRVGMQSPVFDGNRQFGAVAVKAKPEDGVGGTIHIQSLQGGIVAVDRAVDNANGQGGTLTLEARENIYLGVSHTA